jgi:hypothetical protein
MNYTGIFLFKLTQILISKKFEKEIVFKSSVLAWIRIRNRIRNWIRIVQKCWIRIRIKSIRIHNPATGYRYMVPIFQIAGYSFFSIRYPAGITASQIRYPAGYKKRLDYLARYRYPVHP